ncbi:MAG: Asp-tRNA(Asn)/Glu-tRNA(Gln) amidotransferase subunit GatC [Gammaproteobacteria bacterium]|nr:Asp-tRNA(Asn)/Glu-tRNA(Gln) amidotransferase subunit GatC [Gammaproteobacteria bacterium]
MDTQTIEKLLTLSQIQLEEADRDALAKELDKILAFIEDMQSIDTENILPLAHPVDIDQPMREDKAVLEINRAEFQDVAPNVQDGYYIVPKVITAR